jgi:nucleotide-binding universal stress UspA family protein
VFIMRKLESILLATDFRPGLDGMTQAALRLASAFGSHVNLLHVLDSGPPLPPRDLMRVQRQKATEKLRALAQEFGDQNVLVDEYATVRGHPVDRISRKADEIDADLILIGAGEWSRDDWFAVGPHAEALIQHARRPVLAIRPGEPTAKFRKILCPVDMSAVSSRGMADAIQLARALRGHLIVLTVVPEPGWFSLVVEARSLAESRAEHTRDWRERFEQFLTTAPLGGVSWEKEVRSGIPYEEIALSAAKHQADLIVMGSTGRTGLSRFWIGSVTRRVIQRLPCSLLTVKPDESIEENFASEVTTHLLYAEGSALLAARSYPAALVKFDQVLSRDPHHALALEGRREALVHLQQERDAPSLLAPAIPAELNERELGVGD